MAQKFSSTGDSDMGELDTRKFLDGKTDDVRVQIARRVGQRLCLDGLAVSERAAAECLARDLVADAIDQVRQELATAVRHAKYLPRDIALRIAHDIDSIACPFLQATDVFSDLEWQHLVLTISHGARIAVARRTSMSEGLALALSEVGGIAVAGAISENPAAPMTHNVCRMLIERFGDAMPIIEKLAERDGLSVEIAVMLQSKVSAIAREKLARDYGLPDFTEPIGVEAELAAIRRLVGDTPTGRRLALADQLRREGKLTPSLLLHTLCDGELSFFAAALSLLGDKPLFEVEVALENGGLRSVIDLFQLAGIPTATQDDCWEALQHVRTATAQVRSAIAQ